MNNPGKIKISTNSPKITKQVVKYKKEPKYAFTGSLPSIQGRMTADEFLSDKRPLVLLDTSIVMALLQNYLWANFDVQAMDHEGFVGVINEPVGRELSYAISTEQKDFYGTLLVPSGRVIDIDPQSIITQTPKRVDLENMVAKIWSEGAPKLRRHHRRLHTEPEYSDRAPRLSVADRRLVADAIARAEKNLPVSIASSDSDILYIAETLQSDYDIGLFQRRTPSRQAFESRFSKYMVLLTSEAIQAVNNGALYLWLSNTEVLKDLKVRTGFHASNNRCEHPNVTSVPVQSINQEALSYQEMAELFRSRPELATEKLVAYQNNNMAPIIMERTTMQRIGRMYRDFTGIYEDISVSDANSHLTLGVTLSKGGYKVQRPPKNLHIHVPVQIGRVDLHYAEVYLPLFKGTLETLHNQLNL